MLSGVSRAKDYRELTDVITHTTYSIIDLTVQSLGKAARQEGHVVANLERFKAQMNECLTEQLNNLVRAAQHPVTGGWLVSTCLNVVYGIGN